MFLPLEQQFPDSASHRTHQGNVKDMLVPSSGFATSLVWDLTWPSGFFFKNSPRDSWVYGITHHKVNLKQIPDVQWLSL